MSVDEYFEMVVTATLDEVLVAADRDREVLGNFCCFV
jgi:hypothetical protein